MSKAALLWFLSYLTKRRQFSQVNDRQSSLAKGPFGVHRAQFVGLFSSTFKPVTCKIADTMALPAFSTLTTQRCNITPLSKTSMSVLTQKKEDEKGPQQHRVVVVTYIVTSHWMRPRPNRWLLPPSRYLKCIILTDTLHFSPWKIRKLIG